MKPIIISITDDWIKQNNPCEEAIKDWWDKKERDPIKILKLLIEDKKYDWANWFIVKVMEYKNYVSYAIFAAECVLDIYEKKYPDNKRPREAIEAARECVKNPTTKNKKAAADAADAATHAAAYAAAYAADAAAYAAACAAHVAAHAADAAAYAADAAAHAAACAAHVAAHAAAHVAAHAADAIRLKILKYGMRLLRVNK